MGKEFEVTFKTRLIMKRSQLCKYLGKSIPGRENKYRGFKVVNFKCLIKKKNGVYREVNKGQIM